MAARAVSRIRLAIRRFEFLLRGVGAGINPGCARRAAVVSEHSESAEQLLRLAGVAVDLAPDLTPARLALDPGICWIGPRVVIEVPQQVLKALVSGKRAV